MVELHFLLVHILEIWSGHQQGHRINWSKGLCIVLKAIKNRKRKERR
jgi:hypothetical protein